MEQYFRVCRQNCEEQANFQQLDVI